MSFLLSVGLVVAAAAMIVIAAVQASPTLFTAAAVASGLAVILLWRRASAEKEHVLLADSPPRSQPNWDRSIKGPQAPPPDDDDSQSTIGIADDRALGIGQYDDLVAAEIMPSLETLSEEQLRAVLRHEQAGLARTSIIDRARRLIDLTSGIEVDRTPSIGTPGTGPGRNRRQDRSELKKDTGLSL